MSGNLTNASMVVYSTDMSEEEKKLWKTENDICPVCQDKFGGYKQCKTGSCFRNSTVPKGTIIHKKCCE